MMWVALYGWGAVEAGTTGVGTVMLEWWLVAWGDQYGALLLKLVGAAEEHMGSCGG